MKINFDKKMTGEKLKSYRLKKGLSISYLSDLTGISPSSIRNCENGKSSLTIRNLVVLCDFFKKSIDETLAYVIIS